jgi:CobQ-like glutamine amidotransferase family enzyme
MRGLGVFDAWTIHKGAGVARCIGNVAISWNGTTLVGFENHGGRTYLGTAKPLGRVLKGHGNNSEDRMEGAIYRNAYGTYMHGSLLPKNPHFADHLIALALQRKYGIKHLTDTQKDASKHNGHASKEMQTDKALSATAEELLPLENTISDQSEILKPLDDTLEWEAHASMLERLGLYNAAAAALRTLKG